MKAIVITEPGSTEGLRLQDVADPELKPGHIMIDIRATALNRADLLQRRGLYPPPKGETDIMGLECAGVVSVVPSDIDSVREGDRVMALLPGGGYAQRVAVPASMAIPVPQNLSFEQGAAIVEAFLTAREGLFTLGRTVTKDNVLVHAAAGGVGTAAVQLAHQHGARVFATAGSSEKLEKLRELGADVLINYKEQDFSKVVLEETQGKGADVVLDFIGGAYWEQHAQCLATAGRCVVIGVLGGITAQVNLALLLRKRLQILGLVMRSRPITDKIAITRAFVRESLPLFADGRLRPIIDCVFPLAEAGRAHAYMEENKNFGKIVLSV